MVVRKLFNRKSTGWAEVAQRFAYGGKKDVGVRTRILAWYILLITFTGIVSILATREILFLQLRDRLEISLLREVQQFRLIAARPDSPTVTFDAFFKRHIPHDEEFAIAFVDGRYYAASPTVLPAGISTSPLMETWANLQAAQRGQRSVVGGESYLYVCEPLTIGSRVRGLLVAAYCLSCERRDVESAVLVVAEVFTVVMILASAFAWIAAGRVLAPLLTVIETAHNISESDLTRRIPLEGKGEIAELTRTFNEMLDRLEVAFASQRDFINDASHELRTPITIIRGHLELLGDDPDERRETLDMVFDELDRMSRFVEDLLLLAKAEQPRFLTLQTINLENFTEELFAKAKALAPRDWQLEVVGTGKIVADRQRLTQVVMNLAQNAVQYGGEGPIRLGSARDGNQVRFWVQDSGPGIPESEQSRIFERFARAGTPRHHSEGVGLGLAIARAVAEAHGGRVTLLSRPGEGALFTVLLPTDPLQDLLAGAPHRGSHTAPTRKT